MSVLKKWFQGQLQNFSGRLLFDAPLAPFTYYRIGGPADLLAIPKGMRDLEILVRCLQDTHVPYFILGKGSNLLVPDAGFRGMILCTKFLNQECQFFESSYQLEMGSSVSIVSALRHAKKMGWSGLEGLTGIPGLLGGAIAMNAGTLSGCVQDALFSAKVVLLESSQKLQELPIISFALQDLMFTYRKNLFLPPNGLIWSAVWQLKRDEPLAVQKRMQTLLKARKETQPLNYPSCGSVFKNLQALKKPAWEVIDALGLRGYRIGGAEFSQKHSNFIINLGNAKAREVLELIQLAKTRAKEQFGWTLEEEVIVL